VRLNILFSRPLVELGKQKRLIPSLRFRQSGVTADGPIAPSFAELYDTNLSDFQW
jgi:hypothetical protein